jgi:signal transduction histidine kinase/ActR/RegA family two-component response regulator
MADEYARGAGTRPLRQALSAILITQNLRYWLVVVWGFALGYAVDWRVGAAWACVAGLLSVARAEFEQRLALGGFRRPGDMLMIAATINGAVWALAPLLAWNTGSLWSQVIAVTMMMAGLMMVSAQFGHQLRQALVISVPYAALTLWFASHLRRPGAFWPFVICMLVLGAAVHANMMFARVLRSVIDRYQTKQARLIAELEAARDSANAANAAKSAFLAMISHELRTPMNGVLGAAQLLDGANLTPAQKRYVDMIRASGDSLLTLLNDILDFAKIESGRIELEAIEVDLGELIERVCAIWAAKAESKGLDFRFTVEPSAPSTILGDPTRLSQVIHNLLSNATKFTEAGQVSLTLQAQPLDGGRARLVIAVADTGAGIAAADLARLFQPFAQLDLSSTRRYGGTGLGLVISRRLAEMMGGGLEVASEPGRGSVFTFTAEVDVAISPPIRATPASPETPAVRPLSVLVAEDHAINRQLLTLWLEAEGHTFACAENGEVALELAGSQAFDIILMDVNMPVMDGLSAVRRLRGQPGPNRETVVVMLSASARAEDHEAGVAAGGNAYLSKPIDFSALRAVLARVGNEPAAAGAESAVA